MRGQTLTLTSSGISAGVSNVNVCAIHGSLPERKFIVGGKTYAFSHFGSFALRTIIGPTPPLRAVGSRSTLTQYEKR